MAHIYQTLLAKHDFVILVGADIPQMTTAELLLASTWLPHEEQARLVFAPSIDGGFWAFGGNCSIPKTTWTDVVYSEVDTGAQFFNKIVQLGDIKTLSPLHDVDEASDLLPLRNALVNLTDPLPEGLSLNSLCLAHPYLLPCRYSLYRPVMQVYCQKIPMEYLLPHSH